MPDFRTFPGVHDDVLDRGPAYERLHFRERALSQAAELNELVTIADAKRQRVGDMIARDGDRISGCDIVTEDIGAGRYRLTGGRVYVRGDVRTVGEAVLEEVATEGDVQIGVRLVETVVTHEEDPDLLGQYAGALSEGEPGALRTLYVLSWGWSGDGETGALYAVYTLRNGYVIDQSPPPDLTGINAQIAAYDYGAHENYIDEGCHVTALGPIGDDQVFSIAEGIANILGFKRQRNTATRYAEPEAPDIEQVAAEPHVYVDDEGSATIQVNHAPINGVTALVIEKEASETIARGGVANTKDLLSQTSVLEVLSITQGATTFDATDDWLLDGDEIDWSPGGDEPATGSSYDVTYRYLAAVAPDAVTDTEVVASGGVDGGQVLVSYAFKLPRVDRICLDRAGQVVYLKGISAREQPQAPATPQTLLSLCEVRNDWFDAPMIVNNGVRNYPFWLIDRMYNRLVDALDLIGLERLRRDINAREPTAKHKVFVDPFRDDRYRDAGEAQTAAVFDGTCQIAIDPTFEGLTLAAPATLPWTHEVIVRQELATDCQKINPYQVFTPLPLTVTLTPSEDFWEETSETWLSPVTRVFGRGNASRVTSRDVLESIQTRAASFLRQIPVAFEIGNLGNGETVDALTFDGIDVNPGGLVGDVHGNAGGSFVIPANVTTGVKAFRVEGGSGAVGRARFEGRGVVTEIRRQRVTTVERFTEQQAVDPLAQTFTLDVNRHVSGIEVRFCTVGDAARPVVVQIVTVENGIPTADVIAQAEIDMATVIVDTWHRVAFAVPVFVPAGVEHAFVLRTDDADHAVRIGRRGGFDAGRQEWVGAQPYTVGVLLSSSNARTWTPHQDEDLTMRILGALFDPTTIAITLGTIDAVAMSDLIVVANVDLPTDAAQLRFRVTPDGESSQLLEVGQNWERETYFTGDVQIEAVLTGSAHISPVLSRDVLAIPGSMRATGAYVTRAFAMGTAVRQDIRLKTNVPTGAGLIVEVDASDDGWTVAELAESEALPTGGLDRRFTQDPWTAATGGRVRITLTGSPAARPAVSDLRAYSI